MADGDQERTEAAAKLLEEKRKGIDPSGLVGGFSAAYDLVSSEYGWDDEAIGNLPLVRFRQITAAIRLRQFQAAREENSRISWAVRTLAGYIAGGYMTEGENKALKDSQTISYDEIDAALLGAAPASGGAKENSNGSFERFMMMAGQLNRQGRMK